MKVSRARKPQVQKPAAKAAIPTKAPFALTPEEAGMTMNEWARLDPKTGMSPMQRAFWYQNGLDYRNQFNSLSPQGEMYHANGKSIAGGWHKVTADYINSMPVQQAGLAEWYNQPQPQGIDMFNKLAAGKKVYAQGSHAPTRGPVNPSGYVKRELQKRGVKPVGAPSQNRSGWAQQMIDRSKQFQGGMGPNWNPNQPHPTSGTPRDGGVRPGMPQPNVPRNNEPTPGPPQQNQPQQAPVGSNPAAGGSTTGYTPPNYVQINSNGQLDLPYDESYSWEVLQQKQAMNQQLLSLQQQQQQQALEYGQLKRDAGLDYEKLNRSTLNNAAGRGMAFSSLYGTQVADNATNFNNYMNDLEMGNQNFQAGTLSQRGAIENAFNEFLRQSALQRAQQLEGQAGDLGYGQDPFDTTYPNAPALPGGGGGKKGQPKPQSKSWVGKYAKQGQKVMQQAAKKRQQQKKKGKK